MVEINNQLNCIKPDGKLLFDEWFNEYDYFGDNFGRLDTDAYTFLDAVVFHKSENKPNLE